MYDILFSHVDFSPTSTNYDSPPLSKFVYSRVDRIYIRKQPSLSINVVQIDWFWNSTASNSSGAHLHHTPLYTSSFTPP